MSRLIAFDFDGVIVDSVSVLKKVYYDFLNQFGKKGSDTEFDNLNGPTIDEIVLFLQSKYDLEGSLKALLDKYNGLLSEAYSTVPLVKGIQSVLADLDNQGVDLALVTSSLRSEVEVILRKHKMDKRFKIIITGDDVKESKPSPDIYLLLKKLTDKNEIWTVEDSENGIRSALGANINVIYFDQYYAGTSQSVDCRIHEITDIPLIFKGIENAYCASEISFEIEVVIDDGYFPVLTDSEEKLVEKFWEDAQSFRDLNDGKVLYYLSHESIGGKLRIKAFWGAYRYFFCALKCPSLDLDFVPLAVSGFCLDQRGSTLIAKRKNVTEYSNCNELVPSGGISEAVSTEHSIDFHSQLLIELLEETSIKVEEILKIKEVGLVRDLSNKTIDICCQIDLDGYIQSSPIENEEYSSFLWAHLSAVESYDLIPVSRGILYIVNKLGVHNGY